MSWTTFATYLIKAKAEAIAADLQKQHPKWTVRVQPYGPARWRVRYREEQA